MDALFTIFIPLFLFMLIPVWIPLVAVAAGAVLDRRRPAASTSVPRHTSTVVS